METIKTIVSTVCVSMIFYGLASLLVPANSMGKSFKYLVAVAVLASVTLSLKGINIDDLDFSADTSDIPSNISSELNNTVSETELYSVELSVENLIIERIKAVTKNPVSVDVKTDISENGDISITDVQVVCGEGQTEIIKTAVDDLGMDITFTEREGTQIES